LKEADVVISIGTALQTGLANSVISKAVSKGAQVIEINPTCVIKK
jgi:NAD-dependent SIR2 family protein deacetylase